MWGKALILHGYCFRGANCICLTTCAYVSPNEKKKKRSPERSQIGWDKATTKTNSKPINFLTLGKKNQQQVRQIKDYTWGTKQKKKKKKCNSTRTEFSPYMLMPAPTANRMKLNEKKIYRVCLLLHENIK